MSVYQRPEKKNQLHMYTSVKEIVEKNSRTCARAPYSFSYFFFAKQVTQLLLFFFC